MESDYDFEQENYWEDDLYILNQNEADDYRDELNDYDDGMIGGGDSDLMGEW